MKAFYRDNDLLIKAYDQDYDWQLIVNNPKEQERWFSKNLSAGTQTPNESIKSAFERIMLDIDGYEFKDENFSIC